MPVLCRFFGIVVAMYYGDHAPLHIHAYYGDFTAVIAIADGSLLKGRFPQR